MGSNLDEPSAQLGDATVRLNFDSTPASVVVYRIDQDHTNPREIWEQMGKPDLEGESLDKVMSASETFHEAVSPDEVVISVAARGAVVVEASWNSLPIVLA